MTFTDARDPARVRGRLCVVIATIGINVIAVSLLTFAPWLGWRTGAALSVVDNCLLVGFIVVRRDALLARTLRRDSWCVAVVAGVAGGASIFVCYAMAFLITDRLIN
ncbi:MAG: hypothetical protein WA849_04015 [Candidatus Udaeobacter sp.]